MNITIKNPMEEKKSMANQIADQLFDINSYDYNELRSDITIIGFHGMNDRHIKECQHEIAQMFKSFRIKLERVIFKKGNKKFKSNKDLSKYIKTIKEIKNLLKEY